MKTVLNTVKDVAAYFKNNPNQYRYHFVSPSNFNLMDLHRWVSNWQHIGFLDNYDKTNPYSVVPDYQVNVLLDSIEAINLFLLRQKSVQSLLKPKDKIMCLFFSEEIEAECRKQNLQLMLSSQAIMRHIDNKIETTKIGNRVGISSVPNVLTAVKSYQQLCELADQHKLGRDWVIQTAFGDSGKTTYFISNEAAFNEIAAELKQEEQIKLMKRIRCQGTAIEACATRWGTFVGPLMLELIGAPALTPYAGGWSGNELHRQAAPTSVSDQAASMTQKLGDELYRLGYRGYFEVDYLIDLDTNEVFLGEINPRISGVTTLTTTTELSQQELPLFLFHLLEYDDNVELNLSANEFNQLVKQAGYQGVNAQLIAKHTSETLQIVSQAPVSGVYRLNDKSELVLIKRAHERLAATQPGEAFLLRILKEGSYAYQGADLAIVFVNEPVMFGQSQLNNQGDRWASAINQAFVRRDLTAEEAAWATRYSPDGNKMA
jgi:hypothetical protein